MRKCEICKLGIILMLLSSFIFYNTTLYAYSVKKPNVSGQFYPNQKHQLKGMISNYMQNVKIPDTPPPQIFGLISPHAGYNYSGQVAAYGYKALKERGIKTVIILAPSHYQYLGDTIAVFKNGDFQTPLGKIPVDEVLVNTLMKKNNQIIHSPEVFEREHSLEVQLPFLQETLIDFKIVPILLNGASYETCSKLAKDIAEIFSFRENIILIASTDLSHYHTQEVAESIDKNTLDLILQNDPEKLYEKNRLKECELCGSNAVITLMLTMQNINVQKIQLLRYATSAETPGSDKDRVVGYSSILFSKEKTEFSEGGGTMLNDEHKKKLLLTARKSIEEYILNKKMLKIEEIDPILNQQFGAFVTLKKKKSLRGCIGYIETQSPLIQTVNEMAIQAAFNDSRFAPLKKEELDDISIEISVLSPIKQIKSIDEIEVGTHGLIIRKGYSSGLLLPQVATDYNWKTEEFIQQTCLKAGLFRDSWKDVDTKIYIFSAQVFGEE